MNVKLTTLESFSIIGVKRTFDVQNNAHQAGIAQFWRQVKADGTAEQLTTINDGEIQALLGVCMIVKTPDGNPVLDYWIAVASTLSHATFEIMVIPAATWANFGVYGPMPQAMQDAWQTIYTEWLSTQSMAHADAPDMEVYFSGDSSSPTYYSEIWLPVKE